MMWGRGIGESTAMELAKAGDDVAVTDLNRDAADETSAKIRSLGRRSLAIRANIGCHSGRRLPSLPNSAGELKSLARTLGAGDDAPSGQIPIQQPERPNHYVDFGANQGGATF